MQTSTRRLKVVHNHLNTDPVTPSRCSSTGAPCLSVSPTTCLVDETIHIRVSGLFPGQIVTLVSSVEEGKNQFEARAVYRANKDGVVDNKVETSVAGTFTGVEPMGLFWSLVPAHGQDRYLRLIKKDVTAPMVFTISVSDGEHTDSSERLHTPLTSATVRRLYKHPSVRRVPVTEGPYRGTIFIPEGEGRFPGLVDAYGGLVSLVETRASLFASRGFVTFSLCYLYKEGLPNDVYSASPDYFEGAVEWFGQQPYVDQDRIGLVGLCAGGYMVMCCAAICPTVKAVVNINGFPAMPDFEADTDSSNRKWMDSDRTYRTDEGINIENLINGPTVCIPAYQHGAKILTIVGEDDRQTNPKWHTFFHDHCPAHFRDNVTIARYEGAGHLIEPPYSPLCRVMNPGSARMATIPFIKEEYRGLPMLAGGFPKQHAHAQEDAWRRILDFLNTNLKTAHTGRAQPECL